MVVLQMIAELSMFKELGKFNADSWMNSQTLASNTS